MDGARYVSKKPPRRKIAAHNREKYSGENKTKLGGLREIPPYARKTKVNNPELARRPQSGANFAPNNRKSPLTLNDFPNIRLKCVAYATSYGKLPRKAGDSATSPNWEQLKCAIITDRRENCENYNKKTVKTAVTNINCYICEKCETKCEKCGKLWEKATKLRDIARSYEKLLRKTAKNCDKRSKLRQLRKTRTICDKLRENKLRINAKKCEKWD